MKFSCLIIFVLLFKLSHSQSWTIVKNTSIEYIPITDNGKSYIYFKQDSNVIGIPSLLAEDFMGLFSQNPGAVKMICDSFMHMAIYNIGDSAEAFFNKTGIRYVVYIKIREIDRKGKRETWMMTNLYKTQQPCYSPIFIRRKGKRSSQVEFRGVRRGMCEI